MHFESNKTIMKLTLLGTIQFPGPSQSRTAKEGALGRRLFLRSPLLAAL